MRRRALLRVAGAALGGGLAGCTGDGDGRVEMVDVRYDPPTLTVSAGTTVTWVNRSDIPHTVTAYESHVPENAAYFASGGFESERAARDAVRAGLVAPDESYATTVEATGTYEYCCIPHEGGGMTGTVRVR